jgi:hypothetical protein
VSRIYPRPDRGAFDTAAVVIQLMGVLPKRNKEKEGPAIRPKRVLTFLRRKRPDATCIGVACKPKLAIIKNDFRQL